MPQVDFTKKYLYNIYSVKNLTKYSEWRECDDDITPLYGLIISAKQIAYQDISLFSWLGLFALVHPISVSKQFNRIKIKIIYSVRCGEHLLFYIKLLFLLQGEAGSFLLFPVSPPLGVIFFEEKQGHKLFRG